MFTILIIFCILLAIILIGYCVNYFLASKGYRGAISDHFDGVRFYYYGRKATQAAIPESPNVSVWKWFFNRPAHDWKWRENTFHAAPEARVQGDEIVVSYINHATVLIQTQNLNIITDPVWTGRPSPFSFAGPKRYRDPGCPITHLPPIDVILLSHNHYDHMDLNALKTIQKISNPKIITGLGNAEYLASKGIPGAHEMDWWNDFGISTDIKVTAVPAQHFSARAFSDRNKTLWCGFVVSTPAGAIYFAGDTGYGPFVQKIHERFNTFRLALLPIGAFRPEWFMRPVHASPDEALTMHKELNSQTSIGIHFGTFRMADDLQDEAPNRIKELLAKESEPKPRFLILDNGESVTLKVF